MKSATAPFRSRRSVLALLLLILGLALPSCRKSPDGKKSGPPTKAAPPHITATPNPLPEGAGAAITTVAWDTGDGSECEVYVSVNDGKEKHFGTNVAQSIKVDWIQPGDTCEFQLYKGSEHKEVLASVTVTRPPLPDGPKPRPRATITAQPSVVSIPAGSEKGKTIISWDTADDSEGEVFVSTNGGQEKLFGKNVKQSLEAPWISPGSTYEFRLYRAGTKGKPLATVKVTSPKK